MINQITQNFSFEFKGKIWKILPDEQKKLLVLEIRNPDEYLTTFAVIDVAAKKLLWDNFSLDENWWLGISDVSEGKIFFHSYPDSQKPEARGIIAFDIFNKEILWQKPDYRFYSLNNENLIAFYLENELPVYVILDKNQGKEIKKLSGKEMPNLILKKTTNLHYPSHYQEGTAYFATVKKFVDKCLKIEILGAANYLEYKNYLIISYFFAKGVEIQNYLLILEANAQILLNEFIDAGKGIALDTFFVYENQLVSIRQKSELISFQL